MANIANGAVEGQINYSSVSVTAAYTVAVTDELVLADASGGDFTVSLPKPSTGVTVAQAQANPVLGLSGVGNAGQRVTIINVGASGTVTANGLLPQYIRVAGKAVLSAQGKSVTYQSDGSFWDCLGTVS